MELKNALTVCLISLFSATLVLLIARALDNQAAARLEPQLTRIAEELESLRQQGGMVAAVSAGRADAPTSDGLMVYYFHGNTRCPTCRSIESQAHTVVQSEFASELKSETVAWKVLNYEAPSGADLAKKFEIQVPVVVLARMKGGEIVQWKRLDRVWALVGDKPGYAAYVRDEIKQMADATDPPPASPASTDKLEAKEPGPAPADIPVPASEDLPIPP